MSRRNPLLRPDLEMERIAKTDPVQGLGNSSADGFHYPDDQYQIYMAALAAGWKPPRRRRSGKMTTLFVFIIAISVMVFEFGERVHELGTTNMDELLLESAPHLVSAPEYGNRVELSERLLTPLSPSLKEENKDAPGRRVGGAMIDNPRADEPAMPAEMAFNIARFSNETTPKDTANIPIAVENEKPRSPLLYGQDIFSSVDCPEAVRAMKLCNAIR